MLRLVEGVVTGCQHLWEAENPAWTVHSREQSTLRWALGHSSRSPLLQPPPGTRCWARDSGHPRGCSGESPCVCLRARQSGVFPCWVPNPRRSLHLPRACHCGPAWLSLSLGGWSLLPRHLDEDFCQLSASVVGEKLGGGEPGAQSARRRPRKQPACHWPLHSTKQASGHSVFVPAKPWGRNEPGFLISPTGNTGDDLNLRKATDHATAVGT